MDFKKNACHADLSVFGVYSNRKFITKTTENLGQLRRSRFE